MTTCQHCDEPAVWRVYPPFGQPTIDVCDRHIKRYRKGPVLPGRTPSWRRLDATEAGVSRS